MIAFRSIIRGKWTYDKKYQSWKISCHSPFDLLGIFLLRRSLQQKQLTPQAMIIMREADTAPTISNSFRLIWQFFPANQALQLHDTCTVRYGTAGGFEPGQLLKQSWKIGRFFRIRLFMSIAKYMESDYNGKYMESSIWKVVIRENIWKVICGK